MNSVSKIALAVAFAAGIAGTAQAGPIDCPADYTEGGLWPISQNHNTNLLALPRIYATNSRASATDGCSFITYSSSISNLASVDNLNAENIFGYSDWTLSNQGQITGAYSHGSVINSSTWLIGGGYSATAFDEVGEYWGYWSIPDADFENFEYIIAFGASKALGVFSLNGTMSSGRWESPFYVERDLRIQTWNVDYSSLTIEPVSALALYSSRYDSNPLSFQSLPASYYTVAMRSKFPAEATEVSEPLALSFLALGMMVLILSKKRNP